MNSSGYLLRHWTIMMMIQLNSSNMVILIEEWKKTAELLQVFS